jgi:hypothetical protein
MISKKNKIVELIISYKDDFFLNKKISVDDPYVDMFLIIDLVDDLKNIGSDLSSLDTQRPINVYKFNINSENNFDNLLSDISILVREQLLGMNLGLEDIILISKCNEFVDFTNFNSDDLITSEFLVLYHKKIFWNHNLTDNRFFPGSIVTKFSNILQKNFFIQLFDHLSYGFDNLDYIKNKNGWVFFGQDSFQSLLDQTSFGFNKLFLNEDNKNLNYLETLLLKKLPIENFDYLRTNLLSVIEMSEEIKKEFGLYDKIKINPRKIQIRVGTDFLSEDQYDITLANTNNVFDHLKYDEINKIFYVYKSNISPYQNYDKYCLINEAKKALCVMNPHDNDTITIHSKFGIIEERWGILKNKNISDYIENPL